MKNRNQFYLEYPQFAGGDKGYALRGLLSDHTMSATYQNGFAARGMLITDTPTKGSVKQHAMRVESKGGRKA